MSTSHITTVKSPGNYRNLATLHCCACMRALQRSPGFIYLCLFVCFVTCSAVPFCCSFLLGLQHFELPRFFFLSLVLDAILFFFFLTKGKQLAIDPPHPFFHPMSFDYRHTQKSGYAKPHFGILACTTTRYTLPHRCRHLLDYSFFVFVFSLQSLITIFF